MRYSLYSAAAAGLLLLASPVAAAYDRPAPKPVRLRTCVETAFGDNASDRIVSPEDDVYTDARMGETIQFNEFPALLAYAESAHEVPPLIKCAWNSGYKAVPRSGGHHFLSFSALSNTLIIDVTHLDHVTISPDGQTASVGAGIRFGALYTALGQQNLTWPGGICPTVALSGFLASGGFNMQMRHLGLGIDHVLSATVVLSNGRVVTASQSSHTDLFWAIRGGGGGTYGIVVEWTLKLSTFPRSTMLLLTWPGQDQQVDVATRWLEWAPAVPSELTAQLNIFKDSVQILGWYYGGTSTDVNALLESSGLVELGTPEVIVSDGCTTHNSRMFGYVMNECLPDHVAAAYDFVLNTVQQPFEPVADEYPQHQHNQSAKAPELDVAPQWERFHRVAKSFFLQKDNPMQSDTVEEVVHMVRELDDESKIWAEWHAWNLTVEGDDAFAWRESAYAHLEFQIHGSEDEVKQSKYDAWFDELEGLLRPQVGVASYSGYMDYGISSDPLASYYGANVQRLSQIKKMYDPRNFFTNPFSIPSA